MMTTLLLAAALAVQAPAAPPAVLEALNTERAKVQAPPLEPSRPGAAVAELAVARLAITGERAPQLRDWAVVYATDLETTRQALEVWTAAYGGWSGPFLPAAVRVGYARKGRIHALAYQAREAPPVPQPAGDAYGFGAWLNSTRAAYGLPAVGYDPNLASWAATNNNQQASYGVGHFEMGPARRQNAGSGSLLEVESRWMASPAHAAALMDPTIRWYGIAGLGAYWTFNGY